MYSTDFTGYNSQTLHGTSYTVPETLITATDLDKANAKKIYKSFSKATFY